MVEQKRDYFRLEYPYEYRPVLLLDDQQYPLVNLSECGVRFRTEGAPAFALGDKLDGKIVFHDQDSHVCRGEVIRLGQRSVILLLSEPVPLNKIRSEHILLINRFSQKYN